MKLRCVSLLLVALVLGFAGVASAAIVETFNLEYLGSYDPLTMDTTNLAGESVDNGNGTLGLSIVAATADDVRFSVHEFAVHYSLSGLAVDQDMLLALVGSQWNGVSALSTSATYYEASVAFAGNPPLMGPNGSAPNGQSDAPAVSDMFAQNWMNDYGGLQLEVKQGSTTTGNGNGTYGDYAAYLHAGEAKATGAPSSFLGDQTGMVIGTLRLETTAGGDGTGSFSFRFWDNPGYLTILGNNGGGTNNTSGCKLGMGLPANMSEPSFTGLGDTVSFSGFNVPEPSTFALLGCSLFGLLAYAWRKRK